jgi:iron complex outermembrane receptor protein
MKSAAKTRCLRAAVSLALAATAVPAVAAPSATLEEITVTSQRRAETIQSVPIAVSAYGLAELEQRNVSKALDVLQYVPNVVAHNNTGLASANSYYIRGLGNTESLATVDAPVGTYVDEIYVARQSVNNISLFDVERVEVMRGPQGTLFGRNTTGGAVNVIMAGPATEVGGYAEVGVGNYGGRSFRGSVDLPFSDRVLTKFSGYWNEDDGWVRNVTTGEKLNSTESYGLRAALRVDFSDTITWDISGIYTEAESSNVLNFECNPAAQDQCGSRYATTGLRVFHGAADQLAAPTFVVANGKGAQSLGAESLFAMAASNLRFDLGGVEVAAITGYVRSELDFLIDFADGRQLPSVLFGTDPATGLPTRFNVNGNVVLDRPVGGWPRGGFVIAQLASSDQFTQELKFTGSALGGRLDYVAGLFYFNERNFSDFADVFSLSPTTSLLLADRIVRNRTEASAGYAQFDYKLSDRWSATAGIRYTDEEKEFDFSDNRPQCQVDPLPATCLDSRNFAAVDLDGDPSTAPIEIPLDQREKLWTPRFVLNYEASDDMRFYASATRGFKSGSQAARATQVRLLLPVGPEKLWSYELGARTEWLDRRLRVNVTAFLQENEDFQAGTAFVDANGVLNFVTRNLADLDNQGIEVELKARPLDALTLTVGIGYQDMEFKADSSKPDVDEFGFLSVTAQQAECRAAIDGQASPLGFPGNAQARARGYCTGIVTSTGDLAEPVRAPEWTASFGASWAFPVPALSATFTPSVFVLYTDDQEVGTNNLSGYRSAAGVDNFAGDGEFVLGSFSESHTIVNANVTLATDDGRWTAALYCDNCTDETYGQSTLSNYTYLNSPRTYGLKVRLGF